MTSSIDGRSSVAAPLMAPTLEISAESARRRDQASLEGAPLTGDVAERLRNIDFDEPYPLPTSFSDHGYVGFNMKSNLRFNIPSLTHLFSIKPPKREGVPIEPNATDFEALESLREERERLYRDLNNIETQQDIYRNVN